MWSIKKQLQYSIQQYFKKSHHHSGSAMQNWIQPVLVAKWKANHTFKYSDVLKINCKEWKGCTRSRKFIISNFEIKYCLYSTWMKGVCLDLNLTVYCTVHIPVISSSSVYYVMSHSHYKAVLGKLSVWVQIHTDPLHMCPLSTLHQTTTVTENCSPANYYMHRIPPPIKERTQTR